MYIPCSLSVSRELTVPCQYTEFQKPSVKINVEEKQIEGTCIFTLFFKREPRTNSTANTPNFKTVSENKHGRETEGNGMHACLYLVL